MKKPKMNQDRQAINIPEVSPILIKGRSKRRKTQTLMGFAKIVNKYGIINDFKSNRKKEINIFVKTQPDNITPMVKQLQENNVLLSEEDFVDRISNRNSTSPVVSVNLYISTVTL